MAAAWSCALDYTPPKLTVVLDKNTKTRELVENSGTFVIQVPTAGQLKLAYAVGQYSRRDEPDKSRRSGVELFRIEPYDLPFVAGCSAWLACTVILEPHNQHFPIRDRALVASLSSEAGDLSAVVQRAVVLRFRP
jgi:flavin reductase (DIM6/NTAB) family NADH-FMN oxidoreductase RutF